MNISIITVTFNNFSELIETLQSTENLSCERIVINGGSCEKTKAFLESRRDITSISEPDKGISDAFNKGVGLSTGSGLWFLNSGDICIEPTYVEFANKELSHFDFVFADIIYNSSIYGPIKLTPTPNRPLGLGMPYSHPGMIFNRKAFEKIGLFSLDYKIAMDFEFICRMRKAKMRGEYYPHAVTLMDGTGISTTQPMRAFIEDGKALAENNLMNFVNSLLYKRRHLKLVLRSIAEKFGLLRYYQSLKFRFLNRAN
jgi:glycosyltransferase